MADKAPWTERAWDFWVTQAHAGLKDLHNLTIPAFPQYAHGVDEPGTPLNPHGPAAAAEPDFKAWLASQPSPSPAAAKEQEKGMELGG
jgi:hypothetical protein